MGPLILLTQRLNELLLVLLLLLLLLLFFSFFSFFVFLFLILILISLSFFTFSSFLLLLFLLFLFCHGRIQYKSWTKEHSICTGGATSIPMTHYGALYEMSTVASFPNSQWRVYCLDFSFYLLTVHSCFLPFLTTILFHAQERRTAA